MAAAVVVFSGSRSLPVSAAPLVAAVVRSVLAAGRSVAVGCAAGADRYVRSAAPAAAVFRAADRSPAALAARSAACVRSAMGSGPGAGFVCFPSSPCPVGLSPAPRWPSGFGSGTWASAALAAGLGLPVVVFGEASWLPAAWGSWVSAGAGVWSGAWRLVPAARPLF